MEDYSENESISYLPEKFKTEELCKAAAQYNHHGLTTEQEAIEYADDGFWEISSPVYKRRFYFNCWD
jgi:hypothetical protein